MKRFLIGVSALACALTIFAGAGLAGVAGKAKPQRFTAVGQITSIDTTAQTFVLKRASAKAKPPTVAVSVSDKTKIFSKRGKAITFADLVLQEGVKVKGQATTQSDGSVTVAASRIDVTRPNPSRINVPGKIKSIDATAQTFVLHRGDKLAKKHPDISVSITDKTKITWHKQALAFADLLVGQRLVVKGSATLQADGSVTVVASSITVVTPKPHQIVVNGKILSVDAAAQTFVVQRADPKAKPATVTVAVSAKTVIADPKGNALTFADLAVGGRVQVKGLAIPQPNASVVVNAANIKYTAPKS